jgi:hypothetical protein
LRLTITTSAPSETGRTEINSSSSARLMAMMPVSFRGVLYSRKLVFLTMPFFVENSRYWDSLNSLVAMTVWILSPCANGSRLAMCRPLAVRPILGNWWTLSLYTLPVFVKNSM